MMGLGLVAQNPAIPLIRPLWAIRVAPLDGNSATNQLCVVLECIDNRSWIERVGVIDSRHGRACLRHNHKTNCENPVSDLDN
jgi:hypothetical protein